MNKIIEIKYGSHLYGTDTPESDLDFKGIYLPTAKEIVLGTYKESIVTSRKKKECERNTKDDIDTEFFSLDRYLYLLAEGQTGALDMLFAPASNKSYHNNGLEIAMVIFLHRDKLLTKNVNAFVGYAKTQAAKYGIKGSRMDALKRTVEVLDTLPLHDKLNQHLPKIEALVKECESLVSLEKTALVEVVMIANGDKKLLMPHLHVNGRKCPFNATVKLAKDIYSRILAEYGSRAHKANLEGNKDYKALSHAVRVNGEALELLKTGNITFPRPDRQFLLDIKQRKVPYEQIAECIEQGLVYLYEAREKSTLRDEPDKKWIEDFIYSIYGEIVKNEK